VFGTPETVTVKAIPPLFARIDYKTLEPEIEKIRAAQIAEAQAAQAAQGAQPAQAAQTQSAEQPQESEKTPAITIDDFAKVELKIGEIIACEKVAKSSKLLHETVKFGNEIRSIVSGIAKHYTPEELVGKKVAFVTNLPPRTVCGVLSEGMILAADCAEDDVKVLFIDGVPAGSKIR
jgi:methionyl-tRNA synthetase